MDVRVSGLWIHPIKSCRGIAVERALVGHRGFEGDRRHMLVDEAGRFLTQREEPRLALVQVAIDASTLTLSAPGIADLVVPRATDHGQRIPVRIWRSRAEAIVDEAGSRWFSRFLARPCRLVFMPDDVERAAGSRAPRGTLVGFQDGYPFLLTSEASLAELERRAGRSFEMERFRPNIVVTGCEAFFEDELGAFGIGAVRFENVKPCDRCVITTVDPETAQTGKEPLATLSRFRKTDAGVLFGVNLVHEGRGAIGIGDPLVLD